MKRLCFFLMMCFMISSGIVKAQVPVLIGSGYDHCSTLPVEEYYNFSISQQIYTAEEMTATPGSITKVAFKMANASYVDRNISMYMINTEKESFDHTSDWVNLTMQDLVFSGTVRYPGAADSWFEIELTRAFNYTGGNVLICLTDQTGYSVNYTDDARFYTYSTGSSPRSLNKGRSQNSFNVTNLADIYGNYQGTNVYYNNQIEFTLTIEGAEDNPITISPDPISLGERPVGAWMSPYEVQIYSNVASLNVTSIESTNTAFTLNDADTPMEITYNNPATISISVGSGNGEISGQLTVSYEGAEEDKVVEMTATAYTPVSPDVWELAKEVTVFPALEMPTTSDLHNNYTLPFAGENGKDAVYKLVLTSDKLMTVTATGNNAKAVLYEEGFNGKGGPDVDNYYPLQTSAVISNMFVPAGTYYLVAATTSAQLMAYISLEDSPAPSKAFNPNPADMTGDITTPTLSWEIDNSTTEYQVLFDTQNPPQNVVVDWSEDLQTEYTVENLSNNTIYYWQVNTRNTGGTTNGDVWSFSTPFDAPTGLTAGDYTIYEGDNVVLNWNAVNNDVLLGYNIYMNGTKINNEVITDNTYTIEGLTYNMSGYSISVTSVYEYAESAHSETIVVYVTGNNTIAGNVYEVDGSTGIGGVTISLVGKDNFGTDRTYTFTTNAEGAFSGSVLCGEYTATATAEGYQNTEAQVSVAHGETTTIDFTMYETYYPVNHVEATLVGDNVNVEWDMERILKGLEEIKNVFSSENNPKEPSKETRAFSGYNVYRNNINTDIYVSVEDNTTATSFTDNGWSELSAGAYQWGVSVVYSGNRVEQTLMSENFENGSLPEGWTIYEDPEDPDYYISDWNVKNSVYGYNAYEGSYAAFSQGSPVNSDLYLVTSAIDLSHCPNAKLNLHYLSPAWGTDVNTFIVKIADNPTGPWTELYSSNGENISSWTELTIDLSDYNSKNTYIAFVNDNDYGYCVAIDNISITGDSNESDIVWSNVIDKDMTTEVTVTATTNSNNSAAGTVVSFINLVEIGQDITITLDESGTYTWDSFRKGKYELSISKDGYTSDVEGVVVEIWEPKEFECQLSEIYYAIENLYVSPTGWVMWDQPQTRDVLSYDIKLNGILQDNVTTPYYQHDIDAYAFEEGEVYTTTVIAKYTEGSSAPVKYSWTFAECDNFEGASNVFVENVNGSNVLTWEMPEVDNANEAEGTWMFYDDGYNVDGVGRFSGETFYWAIMFTPNDLKPYIGQKLTKVSTFDYALHDGTISIHVGGINVPGTLVHTQGYTCYGTKEYVEFSLTEPVLIGNENIWIVFHNLNGHYIAPAGINTGNPNGRWISEDGVNWYDMFADIEWDYTWNIRAFAEYDGEYPGMEKEIIGTMVYRNGELVTEEPIEGDSYTDNVSEEAEYYVRVVHGGLPNVSYYSMSCKTYDQNSMPCDAPKDLYGEYTYNDSNSFGATLKWPYSPSVSDWLYYDNGEFATTIGTGGSGEFFWGIMFPAAYLEEYDGLSIDKVSMYDMTAHTGTVYVFYGNEFGPTDLLHSQPYTVNGTSSWVELELTTAVPIDSSRDMWVVMSCNDGTAYPASCGPDTGDINGRWCSVDGLMWMDLSYALGEAYTWMLRAHLTSDTKSQEIVLQPVEFEQNNTNATVSMSAPSRNDFLDHYNIYRGTSNDNFELVGETTEKTYFDEVNEAGTYYYQVKAVYVKDGEECESEAANAYGSNEDYVIVEVNSIDENGANGLMVYPNPARDFVKLSSLSGQLSVVRVYNTLGMMVEEIEVNTSEVEINISDYTPGIYFFNIDGEVVKIIKN